MKFSFKRKEEIITVLELDDNRLKIVQVKKFNKNKKISKIILEDITSLTDGKISEKIKELSKEFKINSDLFALSIPHNQVIIKNIELPSTNPLEIKDMIELQVGKQTPFAREEIIYGYEILSATDDGYSRIMLVIVRKEIVNRLLNILEGAKIKTEQVSLSSEGLLNWFLTFCKQKNQKKPCILVDINYAASDFEIIWNNKLIFSRNISLGLSQAGSDINEWQSKFIKQINNSMTAISLYTYQNEIMDEDMDRIIISGAERLTSLLDKDVLKKELNLDVDIISQFNNLPESNDLKKDYKETARDVSFSALLGLVFTYPEHKINLIPHELLIEKGVKERGRDLYFFGIYMVFILATVSSIFLGRIYNKESYLNRLEKEISKTKDKVNKINNMITEIDLIEERTKTKNYSLSLIYEIHRLISPEIHLISFSYDGKNNLVLRGSSNETSAVYKFINTLEKSDYFKDVKTGSISKQKTGNKEMTDFDITCNLEKEEDI